MFDFVFALSDQYQGLGPCSHEKTTNAPISHTIIKVRRPASGPADGRGIVYTVGLELHTTPPHFSLFTLNA